VSYEVLRLVNAKVWLVGSSSEQSDPIRVMIAEDQQLVLGALAALLELPRDITVVSQVRNGRQALEEIEDSRPDVLLADIEMPEMSGLEVAQILHDRHSPVRVIIVTTFARPGYLRRALDAGVLGYLLKDGPATELSNAIRRVHAGLRVIDPQLALQSWTERDPLTDRERAVLRLAEGGQTAAEIGRRLGLADGTVRNYLSCVIGKLGATNRIEAARIAREKGWL
jgi:two-component system, NarL family, response regulator DesR